MKRLLGYIFGLVFAAYVFATVFIFFPYFNWQYARNNGFINWVRFGEIRASATALIWPLQLFSASTDSSWSAEDKLNAAHFFRALNYAGQAVEFSNQSGPGRPTGEILDQERAILEKAKSEAAQVSDTFLVERSHELRTSFRDQFQPALELRIFGLKNRDSQSLNRSGELWQAWADWLDKNKRNMTLPRPSDVL